MQSVGILNGMMKVKKKKVIVETEIAFERGKLRANARSKAISETKRLRECPPHHQYATVSYIYFHSNCKINWMNSCKSAVTLYQPNDAFPGDRRFKPEGYGSWNSFKHQC